MKLTKSTLKQLIKEELQNLREQEPVDPVEQEDTPALRRKRLADARKKINRMCWGTYGPPKGASRKKRCRRGSVEWMTPQIWYKAFRALRKGRKNPYQAIETAKQILDPYSRAYKGSQQRAAAAEQWRTHRPEGPEKQVQSGAESKYSKYFTHWMEGFRPPGWQRSGVRGALITTCKNKPSSVFNNSTRGGYAGRIKKPISCKEVLSSQEAQRMGGKRLRADVTPSAAARAWKKEHCGKTHDCGPKWATAKSERHTTPENRPARLKQCVLNYWLARKKEDPSVKIGDVSAELMAKCEKRLA